MTDVLRILVVSDVSPLVVRGGAERALWEEARGLAARGHHVRIVCRAPAGDVPEAATRDGVMIRHFSVDRGSFPRFVWSSIFEARRAVARELGASRFDVLNVHQPISGFGALLSAAARRTSALYTFHSSAPLEYRSRPGMTHLHRGGWRGAAGGRILRTIEGACLSRAARIHVLSEFSAGQLRSLYGIAPERIVKISGGVDTERFHPAADRAAVRAELGLPATAPLFFTVRNLERRMGLDNLVRAMGLLRIRVPDALLVIGGEGALRPELERQVKALGLERHVRLVGFIPDPRLPSYYQAADAFVLPTIELEGFGLVTVEALACGTPVLGTPVGATPEILAPLDPSLVFDDVTAETMAARLAAFVEAIRRDPPAARRLRETCRRHVDVSYRWERVVERLEAALREVAGAPAASESACAACGGAESDTVVHQGRRYRRCRRCRTASASQLPDPASLRRYYETIYPAVFLPVQVAPPRIAMFGEIVKRLGKNGARGHLLDVGCGSGQLLSAAVVTGWRALGTDLSREACAAARSASGAPTLQADGAALPLEAQCVEAVTLVNVLDHLVDPARVLAEAHRVLTPGGVLAIRVLNGAFHIPMAALLTRFGRFARWTGLEQYPVLHVFSFTADGLRRLVEDAGFLVRQVRNSPLTAAGPAYADAPRESLPALLRAVVAAATRVVGIGSRGRRLLAPSIELYAVKRGVGDRSRS